MKKEEKDGEESKGKTILAQLFKMRILTRS